MLVIRAEVEVEYRYLANTSQISPLDQALHWAWGDTVMVPAFKT